MNLEEIFARHAAAVRLEHLPDEALAAAKREILWVLGIAVAGAGMPGSGQVLAAVRKLGSERDGAATILGHGAKTSPSLAGFANGTFAKFLEYEDKHWFGNTHCFSIGVAVVPAAFAIAESLGGVTGPEVLASVAAATDLEARLINGAPNSIGTPFNSTYIFSHFGAAVAAGRLLHLAEDQMLDAMGLAYTQMAGTFQTIYEGSPATPMQMGFCVRNGIYAAVMAGEGIAGPHQFLTGRAGLYPTFLHECDQEAMLKGLGETFLGTRLGFKGYPTCGAMHQALDAIFHLKARESIAPGEIAAIDVFGPLTMANNCVPIEAKRHPKNHVDQQFSLPWAAACALTGERLRLADFRESALADPGRAGLAQKVDAHLDAKATTVRVVIRLNNGREIAAEQAGPPLGHPDNPIPTGELIERFRECARNGPKALSPERIERACSLVLGLDTVKDAAEIVRLLS